MIHYDIILLTLIFALLRPVIKAETNTKTNFTTLTILNGNHFVKNCNVTYLNNEDPNKEYSKLGTVWFFSSKEDLAILIKDFFIISHNYMFVFDNVVLFQHFLQLDKGEIKPNGLIIANTTEFNNKEIRPVIAQANYPIFMYANSSIETLAEYDIRTEDNNYFIQLEYSLIIYQIPLNYVKWMSLVCLVLSLIPPVWWNIKLRYTPEESILLLQKVIVFLPYLNVILCGLITFQMFATKENGNGRNTSNIYIETVLVTIRAILRTLLWFFIMLVASGWQIVIKALTRDEIKSYIKVYIFIYILICVDQIVDSFTGTIFHIFYPSELKNILFYGIMAIGVFIKGTKTKKFLQRKLTYASMLSPEHSPALRLKLKMIFWHIVGVIVYFALYCIVLTIQKVCFAEYNVLEFILVNYHMLDILMIVFYLIIYHPRQLPDNFNINYGDDEDIPRFGQIYNSKLPSLNELRQEDRVIMLTQPELHNLNEDNNESRIPIVVINPIIIQDSDINKKTINLAIDRLSVGYIS